MKRNRLEQNPNFARQFFGTRIGKEPFAFGGEHDRKERAK